MSVLADVLPELPYPICEFLFLKLPCCIRNKECKELEGQKRKGIRSLLYYL